MDRYIVRVQQMQGGSLVSKKMLDHRNRISPNYGHTKVSASELVI